MYIVFHCTCVYTSIVHVHVLTLAHTHTHTHTHTEYGGHQENTTQAEVVQTLRLSANIPTVHVHDGKCNTWNFCEVFKLPIWQIFRNNSPNLYSSKYVDNVS